MLFLLSFPLTNSWLSKPWTLCFCFHFCQVTEFSQGVDGAEDQIDEVWGTKLVVVKRSETGVLPLTLSLSQASWELLGTSIFLALHFVVIQLRRGLRIYGNPVVSKFINLFIKAHTVPSPFISLWSTRQPQYLLLPPL